VNSERRRRAEEATRGGDFESRMTLDNIPGFVCTMSPAGEIETVNRPILEYFGRAVTNLRHWMTTDAVHPEDLPRVVEAWCHSLATGEPLAIDQRLRRADGNYRWFHVRGRALRDADGHIVRWYNMLTDIHERKQIEEQLQRSEISLLNAQMRLSRAAHAATIGELAASIAHEVNQPLTGVVANSHSCLRWLAAEPANIPKAREAAERIVRDGNDAAEVVHRVRSLFSRAPPVDAPLDLNIVIREVLQLLDIELARRHIGVKTALEAALPIVCGDRLQCQQLILNLLLNAMEALDAVQDRPKEIQVRSRADGEQHVLVEIQDVGPGLDNPEDAFEPFFTTKENGLGLGLTLCRSIVEAHEGRLWATRGARFGTTFSFKLPLRRTSIV